MVYLSEDHFVTAHSSANPAALRVPQGEVVKVKTKDCYSNGLRAENDPRGEAPCPVNACNPATGAIFVEGAHPGDTLRVEVLSIDLDDYGTMRVSPKFGFMKHKVTRPITRAFRLKDGKASLSGVEIPLGWPRKPAKWTPRPPISTGAIWIPGSSARAAPCTCRCIMRARCCPWGMCMPRWATARWGCAAWNARRKSPCA